MQTLKRITTLLIMPVLAAALLRGGGVSYDT